MKTEVRASTLEKASIKATVAPSILEREQRRRNNARANFVRLVAGQLERLVESHSLTRDEAQQILAACNRAKGPR
jgi:hypothetical protein